MTDRPTYIAQCVYKTAKVTSFIVTSNQKIEDGQYGNPQLLTFIIIFLLFRLQFKVNYQHFPLQTVNHNELLKIYWKFITTHHFKKIGQEEKYMLTYLHELFNTHNLNLTILRNFHIPQPILMQFYSDLANIISPQYLQQFQNEKRINVQDANYLKKMLIFWASALPKKIQKTKKIAKCRSAADKKQKLQKFTKQQMKIKQQQRLLNELIQQIDFSIIQKQHNQSSNQQQDNIEEQIARLEKLLLQNEQQNLQRVATLQQKIHQEQEYFLEQQEKERNGQDASCIEWLIHILQQKQIAQSVTKVVNCQRSCGQSKFLIYFQTAMNITPLTLSQIQLKRINLLRQISLFKFYKTGVKSIYSYACHNSAGLADLYQNRMNLSKHKDKDYFTAMKKGFHLNAQLKQQLQQFDVCHHCKYIYPSYLLVKCKFVSERQSMPKSTETEADFSTDSSLQRNRISQRFVSKHRNCFNGYAKINEEYVCGRKYCKSCIKDCYGNEWMKNNNGMCPFCLGVCSCTRCLRYQKMNKLKNYFISLGGNLQKLQKESQLEKLPIKKQQVTYKPKPKTQKKLKLTFYRNQKKTKIISKQNGKRISSNKNISAKERRISRIRCKQYQREMAEQQTQRWSSTAQKQLQGFVGKRTSKRRVLSRLY